MTQQGLAELVDVNRTTLAKAESGAARVSLDLLERLAAATGRSREWLLGEPETVDEFELARERMANAMSKIAAGFEDFQVAVALLEERARVAGEDASSSPHPTPMPHSDGGGVSGRRARADVAAAAS